jgi:hypothetical protein
MNLYAIIGASAIAFLAGWNAQGWRYGEQIATMQKEAAQATTKAVQEERAKAQAAQAKKDEALREANIRAQKNAALARDLDGDINRLRAQLNSNTASLPQASCEASRNYATTVSRLFEACTARYTDVARAASGHASDVILLLESP